MLASISFSVADVVADLQLSNQPDLLPNSNKQTFKYDQLQSQYDAREKRLFAANLELAEKSLACEALAIIVQCFTKKVQWTNKFLHISTL